jgi:hypothetical protein
MVRYGYNIQYSPPAPLVHATVRSPDLTKEVPDFPAQIDTGADRTIIPQHIADDLALPQAGKSDFLGLADTSRTPHFFWCKWKSVNCLPFSWLSPRARRNRSFYWGGTF